MAIFHLRMRSPTTIVAQERRDGAVLEPCIPRLTVRRPSIVWQLPTQGFPTWGGGEFTPRGNKRVTGGMVDFPDSAIHFTDSDKNHISPNPEV